MANGLYNWKTGEFLPHTPNYPSRIQIPVSYDPTATCPTIEEFFQIVFKEEDVPKIIEFIAYCLYRGYPIQKIFILLGKGGTGKSFLFSIIMSFVGKENFFSISPQELTKDRFAGADLYRKLLNVVPDVGDEKIAQTALIKSLSGRDDNVRAQRKYGDPFEFVNFAKLIFGLNRLFETTDKTTGWYRRVEIVRMDHVLGETELSKEFLDKLTSPKELSGLFNLAIKTLPDLLKRNAFTNETPLEEMAEQYEASSNPMKYFCEHFLMNVPQERIEKEELFNKYKRFLKMAGHPVPKKSDNNSAINNFGRYIHQNVDWLKDRPPKDEVVRIKNGKDSKTKSIWPDTKFDDNSYNEWVESKYR
jgi:putative DNA primase/helicase